LQLRPPCHVGGFTINANGVLDGADGPQDRACCGSMSPAPRVRLVGDR
jgi:hypothetical protein